MILLDATIVGSNEMRADRFPGETPCEHRQLLWAPPAVCALQEVPVRISDLHGTQPGANKVAHENVLTEWSIPIHKLGSLRWYSPHHHWHSVLSECCMYGLCMLNGCKHHGDRNGTCMAVLPVNFIHKLLLVALYACSRVVWVVPLSDGKFIQEKDISHAGRCGRRSSYLCATS